MIEDLTRLWDNLFDQIYVINLETNGRKYEVEEELKRVGILQTNKVYFFHTYNTPLKQNFLQQLMPIFWMQNRPNVPYAFDCSFAHYNCWYRSKILGHKRILVLEDDINFLTDINKIYESLKRIPLDADVILFDKLYVDFIGLGGGDDIFVKYNNNVRQNWSAAFYALSDNALSFLCKKQEEKLQPPDEIMVRYYDEINLNRYFINENIGVQCYKYNIEKWNNWYIPWFNLNPKNYGK